MTQHQSRLEPEVEDSLKQAPLFKDVDLSTISELLDQCQTRTVLSGQALLAPGQENHNLYIIVAGTLGIHLETTDEAAQIFLSTGQCVGELSTIDGKQASAHVVADTDSKLFVIERNTLWSLVDQSHRVSVNLLHILSDKLRAGNTLITSNISSRKQAEHYAKIDALTQIHNRRGFDENFERLLKRCLFEDSPLVLAMIDVDNFKVYNDSYGHLAGDHALQAVANALTEHARPYDLIARYGGEEFAVVFPFSTLPDARNAAERLRAGVENAEVSAPDGTLYPGVTISIGLAGHMEFDDRSSLVKSADAALYRAKQSGRNQVSL